MGSSERTADRYRPLLCVATQGEASNDAARLRELTAAFDTRWLPFDRQRKLASAIALAPKLFAAGPSAPVVMEGTGVAMGALLILASLTRRMQYVVSTGDAIGP